VWLSWLAKGQEKARHPHMQWGRHMAFVNHYYYLWARTSGPLSSRPMPMLPFRSGST
jgi:hypothetical protein